MHIYPSELSMLFKEKDIIQSILNNLEVFSSAWVSVSFDLYKSFFLSFFKKIHFIIFNNMSTYMYI